ncbi:hypothetical protein UlMin_027517 [Ulmus minor]
MVQFRINSGMGLSRFKGFGALEMVYPAFWSGNLDCRQISQLVKSNKKRLFLVDTLALVRKLERQGVPLNQPEAITAAITQIEMIQESSLSKFKSQVQSSQGNYFSLLQHETVKLHNDIEKMRSELRRLNNNILSITVVSTIGICAVRVYKRYNILQITKHTGFSNN